jgi:hypothetical protein
MALNLLDPGLVEGVPDVCATPARSVVNSNVNSISATKTAGLPRNSARAVGELELRGLDMAPGEKLKGEKQGADFATGAVETLRRIVADAGNVLRE